MKPRLGYSEKEILLIPFEQILWNWTKIKEEDSLKDKDNDDHKAKQEAQARAKRK